MVCVRGWGHGGLWGGDSGVCGDTGTPWGAEHWGQGVGDVPWGVTRVDGDAGVCGAMGFLWVVTLGSVGEVSMGVTLGSVGTQGPHGG